MARDYQEIFPVVDEQVTMDFSTEYSNCRISENFFLSNSAHIPAILKSLWKTLPDFDCEAEGETITVSGYPPSNDFDASHILELIRKHDPQATKA